MKVIDVLNQIANGEVKLGTKFLWHYKFGNIELTFMQRCGALGLFFKDGTKLDGEIRWVGLFERYNYQILNNEIEIIKAEMEKLDERVSYKDGNISYCWNDKEIILAKKINQIIDKVNKMENICD